MYEPLIARFLSADPLVDGATNPHGWNRFGYAKNRPLTFTDPHGFCSDCHGGGGGGGSSRSSGRGFFGWLRGLFVGDDTNFDDLSPVRVTIPRLNDDGSPMQTVTVFGDPTPPSPELRVDFGPAADPAGGPMPRNLGGGGQEGTGEEPDDRPCTPARTNNPELQDNIVTDAQVGALAAGTLGALLVLNFVGFPEVQIAEGVALSVGGARVAAGLFQAALAEPGGSMAIGGLTAASYGATVGGIIGYVATEPTCGGP